MISMIVIDNEIIVGLNKNRHAAILLQPTSLKLMKFLRIITMFLLTRFVRDRLIVDH